MSTSSHENAIRGVMQHYFDGLYTCNTKVLSKAFHPKAVYVTTDETPMLYRFMDEYFDVVRRRDPPISRNEIRKDVIVAIDIAGENTAAIKATCRFGGRDFVDFLTFVRTPDLGWRIIAKVFHISAQE